ncbi:MAG TPA: hypothetical protein ENH24_03175 [Nitrospirae bacterium]|nr:hypothetical protein [Nitrospirota bacterium]
MLKEARDKAEERFDVLKNDVFFLSTYLSILEKENAAGDIERMIDGFIFPGRIGDEKFYIFLSKLAGRVFSDERAQDILGKAAALFPESRELKQAAARQQTDDLNRYKNYKEKFKGKKAAEAIAEIEGIRELPKYNSDYELHLYLAELYKKTGKYNRAIEIYEYLLKLGDNKFTRKMLGYAYYKNGDYENAIVYLKDIFMESHRDHFLYSALYRMYESKADFEGFEKLMLEALSLNPGAGHLYGLIKRAKKNFKSGSGV